jgi:AraC-like DNA-binding protein
MMHHRHMTRFVTIVVRGGYVEVSGSVPELCREGAVVVHEAGEEHADRFAGDTRCLNVELSEDDRELLSSATTTTRESAELRKAAQGVIGAFYQNPVGLCEAVRRLRDALQTTDRAQTETPEWLQRVIEEFPWSEAVPLRKAAALAGLHETHFSRAFRRHTGMTANEYRARSRVRLASQLLLGTTSSLSRVASSAGLSDQSHLTRLFSERLGVSPGAYRQAFAP